MATRRPLQLDDLTEGDEVEFHCHGVGPYRGVYAGFKRVGNSGVWVIRLYMRGRLCSINTYAIRAVRILKPAISKEENPRP